MQAIKCVMELSKCSVGRPLPPGCRRGHWAPALRYLGPELQAGVLSFLPEPCVLIFKRVPSGPHKAVVKLGGPRGPGVSGQRQRSTREGRSLGALGQQHTKEHR